MDTVSPEQRSAIMARVKSHGTEPELKIRRLVWGLGYRYRLNDRRLPGRPDLLFPRLRKIIFVHGCFWHQHSCPAAARPSARSEYWNKKLERNMLRDRKNLHLLRKDGWSILVVWECQIRKLDNLTSRIVRFLET